MRSSSHIREVDRRRMRRPLALPLAVLASVLFSACASAPKPIEAPGISMEVTAVRQGADGVLVTTRFTNQDGTILAAPQVLATVGEDASISIAGGDPTIDVVVQSRAEGRLAIVEVAATVRYADGRTASPLANLSTSWGLASRSGR
jgi:hypothetical protein